MIFLAFQIAVSATDLEKVKAFFETYEECSKELELGECYIYGHDI
jgi:hypothetical protein